jgi:hypothetical protein
MTQKLAKYTLQYNEEKEQWDLKADGSKHIIKSFEYKIEATAGGVLRKALGKNGGSVKIQKRNGRFQEERTYPRSADPRGSRG